MGKILMFVSMPARHGEKHFRHKYTVKHLRLSTAHAVDQVEVLWINAFQFVTHSEWIIQYFGSYNYYFLTLNYTVQYVHVLLYCNEPVCVY